MAGEADHPVRATAPAVLAPYTRQTEFDPLPAQQKSNLTLFGGCATDGVFGTCDFDMMGFTNKPASIDLVQEWADFFLCDSIKDCVTNPAGSNAWGFCDEEVDEALKCSGSELDPDKRVACIKEAQKLVYDEYIALYVYDRVDIYSANKRVEGVNPTVFGSFTWNYVDWAVAK